MRVFLNLHFSVYNTSWCVNARQRNAPSLVLANILQARPMTRLSLLTQQPLMFAIKILFRLFHRSLHISYTDVCAHCALRAPAWILVCKQKQKLVFAFISLKTALYVTMFTHRSSKQLHHNYYIFFRKNQIKSVWGSVRQSYDAIGFPSPWNLKIIVGLSKPKRVFTDSAGNALKYWKHHSFGIFSLCHRLPHRYRSRIRKEHIALTIILLLLMIMIMIMILIKKRRLIIITLRPLEVRGRNRREAASCLGVAPGKSVERFLPNLLLVRHPLFCTCHMQTTLEFFAGGF